MPKYYPAAKLSLCLGICLFIFLGIHLFHLLDYDQNKYYKYNSTRIFTTADAFYHARLAQDIVSESYESKDPLRSGERPSPVLPLALVAASLHTATGLNLEDICFFVGTLLAALSVPLMFLWGRELFNQHILMGSCLATFGCMFSFAWYRRVALGKFDTDSLNMILTWLLLYCVYKLYASQRKIGWAGAAGAVSVALVWWWPQAGVFFVALGWVTYLLSVFLPSSNLERRVKICIIVLILLVFCASLFDLLIVPSPVHNFVSSFRNHIELAFGLQAREFVNIGDTVAELSPPSLPGAIQLLYGAWWAIVPVAGAFLMMLLRRKELLVFLGFPTVVFVCLTFGGQRFLMFLSPCIGLGLGFLYSGVFLYFIKNKHFVFSFTSFCLCFLTLIPSIGQCHEFALKPPFNVNAVRLTNVLNEICSKDAKIWNWWGPGYFLQYYGKRQTIIDGGSQEPYRAFIASVPLASSDPVMSKNWMRFFSVHFQGLNEIASILGDKKTAVDFLKEAFMNPEKLHDVLIKYHIPKNRDWQAYLFPEVELYLALYSDMLVRGNWISIGRTPVGVVKRKNVKIFAFPFSECKFNLDKGYVRSGKVVMPFGLILSVTPKMLSHSIAHNGTNVVVAVQDVDKLFYMQNETFNNLAFHLLFIHPRDTQGFEYIAFNPFVGGVWKVE